MHGRFPDILHLPEVKVQRMIKADFCTGFFLQAVRLSGEWDQGSTF